MTVKIDTVALKINAGKAYGFTSPLHGTITDINDKDGKKEILIYEDGTDENDGTLISVIAYLNKRPRVVMPRSWWGDFNGSGYKLDCDVPDNDKKIKTNSVGFYVYVYERYRADGSGFDRVKSKYYRSAIYTMLPTEGNGYESAKSQFDVMLAKKPGGRRKSNSQRGRRSSSGCMNPEDG